MAGADYYSCDVCHDKTFYDAELDWEDDVDKPFLPVGAGQMKVICPKCAKTYEVVVRKVRRTDNSKVESHGTG